MIGLQRLRTRVSILGLVAAIGMAIPLSGAMAATEVTPPADPVAKAAFDVLEKHCARCHQEGKLVNRERPSKNFGNVLKLDEIAANPHYILPGNPFGSKLLKQIVDKEMPYDTMYEGAPGADVTEGDVKALEAWIKSLGQKTAACDARQFVASKDIVGIIAADLEKVQRARTKSTRYLTLTHLKNACVSDEALNVYRQASIKLLNSLSRSSDIVRLETVDPEGTIIRFNLDDLGWSPADWDSVLAVYPYNLLPDSQLTAVLENATGTKLSYVRADWFAYTASRPGLYEKLLALPKNFPELAKAHNVDLDGNIKKFLAQRAGFQRSGVSRNNRLIERHSSRNGYFWTSYDFAGNKSKQSLFEHPLGPGGANGFDHDGGETIFSLPNGFQAYYLNTAKGEALNTGPTNIVQDPTSKDLAVTNGISCMGCHDQGMRKAKDDIRSTVLSGRAYPKATKDAVEALYPPHEKMDQVIEGDAKRFADAMARAGLDPSLKLNGVEMITALSKRYEDDVDVNLAAAELGMSKDQFIQAGADVDKSLRALVRRLEQAALPRDQFEAKFKQIALDLTDDVEVKIAAAGAAAAAVKDVKAAIDEKKKKADLVGDLTLISDQDVYKQGDSPVFTVIASKDCFLTLTNVDQKGIGTVLFPNKFQTDNRIKGKAEIVLPKVGSPFSYRMKDQGVETVTAVCTDKNTAVDGIKHDFTRSALTSTGDYTRSLSRGLTENKRQITIEPAKPATPQGQVVVAKPVAPPPPPISFRAAIQIEVK
jgi:hypothetical protein